MLLNCLTFSGKGAFRNAPFLFVCRQAKNRNHLDGHISELFYIIIWKTPLLIEQHRDVHDTVR